MYAHMLTICLVFLGILTAVLFVILTPLMLVLVARGIREELDLRKGRKIEKKNAYVGRHWCESRIETAKRELREEKERQAREDSFFDYYYKYGVIESLDHPEAPHPAYNLPMDEANRYNRLMDEMHDSQIIKVMNEGL